MRDNKKFIRQQNTREKQRRKKRNEISKEARSIMQGGRGSQIGVLREKS